jgi:hypothetical protein
VVHSQVEEMPIRELRGEVLSLEAGQGWIAEDESAVTAWRGPNGAMPGSRPTTRAEGSA